MPTEPIQHTLDSLLKSLTFVKWYLCFIERNEISKSQHVLSTGSDQQTPGSGTQKLDASQQKREFLTVLRQGGLKQT